MSRIGKKPIDIPEGVAVEVKDGVVRVRGPKGELVRVLHPLVAVTLSEGKAAVDVARKEVKKERALWGTFAAHIRNMILGVTKGFKKQMEVNGVGYRVAMQGKDVRLDVGYSHPVIYRMPEGVAASVEKNIITIESADKELVGRVAAEIRAIRKPEPYKGKGIKYIEEVIKRKAGKAAKAVGAY